MFMFLGLQTFLFNLAKNLKQNKYPNTLSTSFEHKILHLVKRELSLANLRNNFKTFPAAQAAQVDT